jgi:hypothetical protein
MAAPTTFPAGDCFRTFALGRSPQPISDGIEFWGSGTYAGSGAKKVFAFGL